jgi:hypothetical protein
MIKIKVVISSAFLFLITFFILHNMIGDDILLNIYGGNFILYFIFQISIVLVFVLLDRWFKIINLFQYIFLITFGMLISAYFLHVLIPSFMPQAFESVTYVIYYFIFHYIVNLIIYYILKSTIGLVKTNL